MLMYLLQPDNLATMTIWAECRSEPFEGMCAVGEVIRNRMGKKYFSDGTVADTVMRPYQFSCFNTENGWRKRIYLLDDEDPIVRECFRAWVKSETTDYAKNALLYCNGRLAHPNWAVPEKLVAQWGQHQFYST